METANSYSYVPSDSTTRFFLALIRSSNGSHCWLLKIRHLNFPVAKLLLRQGGLLLTKQNFKIKSLPENYEDIAI